MADTNETIADIIAEKRRQADEIERDVSEKMKRGAMVSDRYARELVADIRREADRLEAAHKRGTVEVSTRAATFAINKTNEEWRQKLGDAAKLREALIKAITMLAVCEWPDGTDMEGVEALRRDIDAALDVPPRNCDVMDWRTAWKMWREKFHPETPVGYSAVVKGTEAFMDWFTAPATEKEGGAE